MHRQLGAVVLGGLPCAPGPRQQRAVRAAHCRQVLRDARQGAAAPALDIDSVADRLWFCFGPAAWRSLVVDCGWSYDAAERLLAGQAVALLQ
jgi:hypothetical protein